MDHLVQHIHRLLLDHLPARTTRTPRGWITLDCPMCTDTRKRAGIIISGAKISYNCFNCKYKTGWNLTPHLGRRYRELAERLGASATQIHTAQIDLLKHADQLESVELPDTVYRLTKFDTVDLPEKTMMVDDLPDHHPVKQYAHQRGLLGVHPFLYFDEPLYKQRLVIPFLYDGELVGWTGRHVAPPNKSTPKYLHNMQPGFVFNTDRFANTDRQLVIVTEGAMDAIAIDGISVLGNTINQEQSQIIKSLNKRVILCPDRDTDGQVLIEQALELGWEVSIPPWFAGCKDAAQAAARYGRLLTVASIIKHATSNKLKTQVKMRML